MQGSKDKFIRHATGKRAAREAHWREQISLAKHSGLSVSKYCQSKGISVSNFYRWQQKFSQQAHPDSQSRPKPFVRVEMEQTRCEGVRMELGRGVLLRFDREPSAQWIGEVAAHLRLS